MFEEKKKEGLQRVVEKLTTVLRHCEFDDVEEVVTAFREEYDRQPKVKSEKARGSEMMPSSTYVLTKMMSMWRSTPAYTDENGAPRPIKMTGSEPSIESLLEKARAEEPEKSVGVTPEVVVKFLTEQKAIEAKEDGRFELIAVALRIVSDDDIRGALNQLNYIHEFCSTIAHNAYQGQGGRAQWVARAGNFPKSKVALLDTILNDEGLSWLLGSPSVVDIQNSSFVRV